MFEANDKTISKWKEEYGTVYLIRSKDKTSAGYFRPADRKILGHAQAVGSGDPYKFNEILLRDCWLAGDEDLLSNEAKFLGVSSEAHQLIEVVGAEVEKL